MKSQPVIKKAILSEKAYKQMEKGIYIFMVDQHSTKDEIAKAVAAQFTVNVEKVNVAKVLPKMKRITGTRKQVKTGGFKKAVVWLKSGQSIAMLAPKKASDKKSKSTKKEKDVQTTAESKEG